MNCLKSIFIKNIVILISFIYITYPAFANDIQIEIIGNNFTDEDVIKSIIVDQPKEISNEYSNYLLKTLDNSKLFKNVSVKTSDNKYLIEVVEYANINEITFDNNERLKDEELSLLSDELNLTNLNPIIINSFINEVRKIYESFGYNNLKLNYEEKISNETNTARINFIFDEGEITKIQNIYFEGNQQIKTNILKSNIKSKTKSLANIFANNNYKQFVIKNDTRKITKLYLNYGFRDVKVDYKVEFLNNNKVNIIFQINEGNKYIINSASFLDKDKLLNQNILEKINTEIKKYFQEAIPYSPEKIEEFKIIISNVISKSGLDFFEINILEKLDNRKIEILYEIINISPKYVNQINIFGNSRTFDYVIRRELLLIEGDPVNQIKIDQIKKKVKSLGLFDSVEVEEIVIDEEFIDLNINVKERPTGSVNAGLAVGTIEGFSVVAGLTERNFAGTGRSVKALINTSDDKNEVTFETVDRLFNENSVNIRYGLNYKEQDFATASSYKLNTLTTGLGLNYEINPNLFHNIDLDYVIKDYTVTNENTVAKEISKSQGESVSFVLNNNLRYSTLNSFLSPQEGRFLQLFNSIESPTSSSNGYIKNVITFKNYIKVNKNILSNQTRFGNISSLGNNDILSDNKFSLGGKWLRGFDVYGVGPRNSPSSYVGGENLLVSKFDYSREIFDNSDFPIFLNLFNDYGVVWQNKTKPTHNDNNLRSSVGFGLKYYSPIGPIGFSWGFPIMDESYDIKRMFLFTVGNID